LAAPICILAYYADKYVPHEIRRVYLTAKKDFAEKNFHGHSAMPPGECHSGQQSGQNIVVLSGVEW